MTATTVIKGMTWSDPRGYDPMIAASAAFEAIYGNVEFAWDKRSLQGFESTPVEELAETYDLMIIDHPHIGAVARHGCLLALDDWLPEGALTALANETVGKSFVSYAIDGHQWALPVDAATQVQAHRPDLCERAANWEDVETLARSRRVILPMRPPHSLMCLYTLAANLGHPCGSDRTQLLDEAVLLRVFEALKAVTDHIDPACFGMDPIAALDRLATEDTFWLAPLTYLYKGYSDLGYRAHRLAFTDIPPLGRFGPVGSALGGTGLAVSSRTSSPETCVKFASWVASAACQAGLYADANGQPGNAVAWASAAVNAPVLNAYWNTRLTHEAAWLRPRHHGYMAFQGQASDIVNAALLGQTPLMTAVHDINRSFAQSFEQSP